MALYFISTILDLTDIHFGLILSAICYDLIPVVSQAVALDMFICRDLLNFSLMILKLFVFKNILNGFLNTCHKSLHFIKRQAVTYHNPE